MKNTQEIDGWFNYKDTFDFLISTIPYEGKFAECGAWLGKSSSYLCDKLAQDRPDITPYIIDSWQASDDETEMLVVTKNIDVYQTFLNNMGKRKFEHVKALSVDACKQFSDNFFDVIFIDMCHLYDYVKQDIEVWYPKLKLNGYMSGHDFSRSDVNRAVYEKFSYTNVLTAPGDCWVVQKTKENL